MLHLYTLDDRGSKLCFEKFIKVIYKEDINLLNILCLYKYVYLLKIQTNQ